MDSRRACIAVAAENIKALRCAQATGTIAKLSPIPPQYKPRHPTTTQQVQQPLPQSQPPPHGILHARAPAQSLVGQRFGPSGSDFPSLSASKSKPIPLNLPDPAHVLAERRIEAQRQASYSAVLIRKPHFSPEKAAARRQMFCTSQVAFILITKFAHRPYSQTKEEFNHYLEPGTDILHMRRMQFDCLEIALPRFQLASVSQQLRQLGFILKRDYVPTEKMVRRRPQESPLQAQAREDYCAHRAFCKVAENPRTQPVVRAWFAQAAEAIEARNPKTFTEEARAGWSEKLQKEAKDRRLAETAAEPTPTSPPAKSVGAQKPASDSIEQRAKDITGKEKQGETAKQAQTYNDHLARDKPFPADK